MGNLIDAMNESEWSSRGKEIASDLNKMTRDEKIIALNALRREIAKASPFEGDPVDCVEWVPVDDVQANDYNPNTVAPPEMKLLELSILADGYTQPIVTYDHGTYREVVDGFHRSRVGRESDGVRKRTQGYVPVVTIRSDRTDDTARMTSTIRHNRARGKHGVEPMTGIVMHLAKKGWTDEKIAKELGMDPDEVLRFKQITGLSDLFSDREFSEAWEAEEIE